jgi:hypothetical protein
MPSERTWPIAGPSATAAISDAAHKPPDVSGSHPQQVSLIARHDPEEGLVWSWRY